MSARPRLSQAIVPFALLALAAALAFVRRGSATEPYSVAALTHLLRQPVQGSPGLAEAPPAQLWHALLAAPFAETSAASTDGPHLRLGRVWAAPTVATLAAEHAGELLALEAEGADGPTGLPLWRVILDGPSTQAGALPTLALYGCRHSSDPDAAPVLEDTYAARLSLAHALEEHARDAGLALTLRGIDAPAKGGVNFEVQLVGEEHAVRVTFDGHPGLAFRARRRFRPAPPYDALVRANLVTALHALAAEEARFAKLVIEGEPSPAAGGVDLRIELVENRLALSAAREGARLRGHVNAASASTEQ